MLPSPFANPWFQLSLNTMHLAFEAQALIGLRLFRMVTGGVPAIAEASRMVPEKMDALAEVQRIVALSAMMGQSHTAPAQVVHLYRNRVRANQTRLSQVS